MNTAEYVNGLIVDMKTRGILLSDVAWAAAKACEGWAYVFGARGQYCDPVNRRNAYKSHGDEHPTIKSSCMNFDGSDQTIGNCAWCKWLPNQKRTRFFDCRGFTYWILKQVFNGWELLGAGATSQWNTVGNWKSKGEISTMPKDTLCCLFVKKGNKMEHTGFGYNNETVECSVGVQYSKSRNKKWTHWAVPACIDGDIPTPTPSTDKPTLRKGMEGEYVTLLQSKLYQLGYDLGAYGIDGSFGAKTETAVKEFQKDHGLSVDGIVGQATWDALDSVEPSKLYTVTIQHLPFYKAEGLVKQYDGCSYMKVEE